MNQDTYFITFPVYKIEEEERKEKNCVFRLGYILSTDTGHNVMNRLEEVGGFFFFLFYSIFYIQ